MKKQLLLKHMTQGVQAELRAYTLDKASKNMDWHQDTSLRGMCAIGTIYLKQLLDKKGIKSQPFCGIFNLEEAGADTRKIDPHQQHCWVEVEIEGEPWIADPTVCQFFTWMPTASQAKTKVAAPKRLCPAYQKGQRIADFSKWPDYAQPFSINSRKIRHIDWLWKKSLSYEKSFLLMDSN